MLNIDYKRFILIFLIISPIIFCFADNKNNGNGHGNGNGGGHGGGGNGGGGGNNNNNSISEKDSTMIQFHKYSPNQEPQFILAMGQYSLICISRDKTRPNQNCDGYQVSHSKCPKGYNYYPLYSVLGAGFDKATSTYLDSFTISGSEQGTDISKDCPDPVNVTECDGGYCFTFKNAWAKQSVGGGGYMPLSISYIIYCISDPNFEANFKPNNYGSASCRSPWLASTG